MWWLAGVSTLRAGEKSETVAEEVRMRENDGCDGCCRQEWRVKRDG